LNNRRIGLATCGVIVALVAAGCGSSATSGNSGATGGPGATAAPSPSNTQPSWAKSLGPGVTVTSSSSATAGDGSPAGAILAEVKDMQTGHYSATCSIVEPSQQATCKSQLDSVPTAEIKDYMPTYKNLVTTYTAIDGDKALVGNTGSVCFPTGTPKCVTNTDPAAIFDSGKSFTTLWNEAGNTKNSSYTLARLIKVNGAWYGYSSSS
jgi:hypothetical protein